MRILSTFVFILALMLNAALAEEPAKQASDKVPVKTTDTDTVAKKFAEVCSKCHGPTGRGMASFPRLSDKKKEYLVNRLKQYRAGEKVGPNTPLMAPHAVNLTDAEIDGFATYISSVLSTK